MDRAPPEVVLALPERVWQPDIAWEKSSCSSASGSGSVRGNGAHGIDGGAGPSRASGSAGRSGTSSSSTSPSPHSRSTGAGGAEALKVDTQMAATLPNTVPLKTSAQSQALQFSNTTSASAAGGGGGSKRSRSRSSTATAMSSTSAQSMHTARTSQSISNSDRVTGMSSGSGGVAAPLPARDLYSTASAPISPVDGFNSNTSTPTATTFGRTGPLAAAEGSRRYSVTRNGRVRDISAPPPSASNSVASEYHSFPSREPSLDPAFRRTAPQSPSTIRTVQQQHRQPTQPSRSHETAHTHAHTHKKYYAQDECAICMDDFQPGQIVRILPCGHVFHKDECDEWLMKWRKLVRLSRALQQACDLMIATDSHTRLDGSAMITRRDRIRQQDMAERGIGQMPSPLLAILTHSAPHAEQTSPSQPAPWLAVPSLPSSCAIPAAPRCSQLNLPFWARTMETVQISWYMQREV